MSYSKFVHLRTHSSYSLSEGAMKVDALVDLTVKNAMPAVAMTDTNNIFGALEFSIIASSNGVQPIIGTQIYITPFPVQQHTNPVQPEPDQLVLLVQNAQGYVNLMQVLSIAFMETKGHYTPQVSLDVLQKFSQGLLCLTGGKQGAVNKFLVNKQQSKAEEYLSVLHTIFGDRLYIELQRHGDAEQDLAESSLLEYAYRMHIPLVATNNVFFAHRDMFEAHDALLCVAQGVVIEEKNRTSLNAQYYYKSADEMAELFKDIPEAIDNTLVIAKRCAYKVEQRAPLLPEYPYLQGRTEMETLRALAEKGLHSRLQQQRQESEQGQQKTAHLVQKRTDCPQETTDRTAEPADIDRCQTVLTPVKVYKDRMEYELRIIEQMGFAGYFLIVADIVQWAKGENIPVGPGRGSGAGSIVAWALNITDLDPIRFGLLFERFLNPERVSMPDFDIDFCQDRRDEIIRYVQRQYGRDKVAQIITFGKLQARAVVRDVGRVLSIPYTQVDGICKRIPNTPANPVHLQQVVERDSTLKAAMDSDSMVKKLMDLALKLEGLHRHASTHAAGVVIGDRPLTQLVALYRDPKSDIPVTQFNVNFVEKAGLVKFDFLGLKTLSIIQMAVNLINKRPEISGSMDISRIDMEDTKTYSMIGRGDTVGVFQLESGGMRKVLVELKPDRLEDIIAVLALYRPGPMENIPAYIACKHGRQKAEYLHPVLQPLLEETFGIPVYQEQVIQMAQTLAGYSLGKADLLRRAMGKKIPAEMAKHRQIFKDGARKYHDVEEKLADSIFDQINAFAGYGFNKSHAAAYAILAYQTAWLKANYPVEFMAASMTYEMANTEKLSVFARNLKAMNIVLLPPDINHSFDIFTPQRCQDGEGKEILGIRYALPALKNVGEKAVQNIIAVREKVKGFTTLYHFFETVPIGDLNRRMLESLCKAGVFDSLHKNRKQVYLSIDVLLKYAGAVQEEENSVQDNLFGQGISHMIRPQLVSSAEGIECSKLDVLADEYEATGFYLSAHPLSLYASKMDAVGVLAYGAIATQRASAGTIRLAGVVASTRFLKTQKGKPMIIADFSDLTGFFSILFFEEIVTQAAKLLKVGAILCVDCTYSVRGDLAKGGGPEQAVRLTASSLCLLEEEIHKVKNGIKIFIDDHRALQQIQGILHEKTGEHTVIFILQMPTAKVEMILQQKYAISPHVLGRISTLEGVARVGNF